MRRYALSAVVSTDGRHWQPYDGFVGSDRVTLPRAWEANAAIQTDVAHALACEGAEVLVRSVVVHELAAMPLIRTTGVQPAARG